MQFDTIIDVVILGVVEGVTEFIPVSSTAHLLLAGRLLGFESAGKAFEVLIQLGAILALLSLYAGRLWQIAASLPRDRKSQRFVIGVLIAFLPAAILGVLLHGFITEVLFLSPLIISAALLIGGIVLLWLDRLPLKPRYHEIMEYPLPLCLAIGIFQVLSLVPGVSRSGATIAGALLLGTDKRSAAEYSFFLAMPTMAGAFAFDLYQNLDSMDSGTVTIIAIGFVTAFVSALIVVRSFLGFVSRHGFAPFAWWRIIVGAVGIAFFVWFGTGGGEKVFAGSGDAASIELAARAETDQVARQDGGERAWRDAEALDRPLLQPRLF